MHSWKKSIQFTRLHIEKPDCSDESDQKQHVDDKFDHSTPTQRDSKRVTVDVRGYR